VARSNAAAAGIGGGYSYRSVSSVGQIELIGANVHALSFSHAAAIGGGYGDDGSSTVDSIEINGTTCVAIASHDGAGIGGGYSLSGESTVGTIRIGHSTINASGYNAAAIGAGHGSFGNSSVEELSINSSMIRAFSQNGPGIGSGHAPDGEASLSRLLINCSDVTASSSWNGAGIGSGIGSTVDYLEIRASKIDATALINGAGIGSAVTVGAESRVRSLLIEGSWIAATGRMGAGIGAGESNNGVSDVAQLHIKSSRLTVVGSIGIGAPNGGSVGNLELSGEIGLTCFSEADACFSGTPILATTSRIHATTDTRTYVDPKWAKMSDFGALELFGEYRVTSQGENFGAQPMLHFGRINGLSSVPYTLTFREVSGTEKHEKSFQMDGTSAVGVIASTGMIGTFAVDIAKEGDGQVYQICEDADTTTFKIGAGETFVTTAKVCGPVEEELTGNIWVWIGLGITVGVIVVIVGVTLIVTRRSRTLVGRTKIAEHTQPSYTCTQSDA
jgi:hypothetical protein